MTVLQLIKALQKHDPKRLVVMASDPEGNSFDSLRQLSTAAYDPRTREIGLEELTPEMTALGYTEDEVMSCGKAALVLYP